MKPVTTFQDQPRHFWAHVKLLSEGRGYSVEGKLKRYTPHDLKQFLSTYGLSTNHLDVLLSAGATYGELITTYIDYRANILETFVATHLMNREQAKLEFERIISSFTGTLPLSYNKQSGEKKHPAYLTSIINLLTEKTLGSPEFNHNPQGLIVVTDAVKPLRVFSRRMDGAYPSIINPLAVWEIKEYYGSTTFGSRIADGVYETMLDGEEFTELREHEAIDVKHYLVVDDYHTWWKQGKSYLCRMIDMLHMGLVDEVLFGREVITRWPEIVNGWKSIQYVRPDIRPTSPKVLRERASKPKTLWND